MAKKDVFVWKKQSCGEKNVKDAIKLIALVNKQKDNMFAVPDLH